jgi:transposase InsO family protein
VNQILHMDILHLPREAEGSKHVLCMRDGFSNLVGLIILDNLQADHVCDHVTSHIQNGHPETIMSDNGTEFANKYFASLKEDFGISSIFSVPKHSASNGKIEVVNREVNRLLRTQLIEMRASTNRWGDLLRKTEDRMNSSTSEVLGGYAPYEVHYGVKVPIPGMLPDKPEKMTRQEIDAMNEDVLHVQQQHKRNAKNRHARSKAIHPVNFGVNDFVWVYQGIHGKLDPVWYAPARVIEALGDHTFIVRFIKELGGSAYTRHAKNLRRFWSPDLRITSELLRTCEYLMSSRKIRRIREKLTDTGEKMYLTEFEGAPEPEAVSEEYLKKYYPLDFKTRREPLPKT